ncbi:MAG: class I SAM-dependent methyltransferase [Nitrososphaerota archaeon]|nr:class I SAM-dependent methyltransferase [Nitrososphaerota archaeon]
MEFPKLYTDFAKYYDKLESQYRDYELEAKWLAELLAEHGAREIVDVSCGTGSHVCLLSRDSDFRFRAMDASGQMIKIARGKVGRRVDILRADFTRLPYVNNVFDAAICMYWSLAGLNDELVRRLFSETNSILKKNGLFVFDVENAEGIKEDKINVPFIDAFFEDDSVAVVRTNFSTKSSPDTVDWHAFYMLEKNGVSEVKTDRMNLRFYSKTQLERLLDETGFKTLEVRSGPYKEYEAHSPSLYFIAQKI